MNGTYNNLNLFPIPWMKKKLEIIYDKNIEGNLFLMYKKLNFEKSLDCNNLINIIHDSNIIIDNLHPIYFYFPFELNEFTKNLILNLKKLLPNLSYIILGGFKDTISNLNELDYINNVYSNYPELRNIIDYSYLIDDSKVFEIFTSLSDTQRIHIHPNSSCTLSGISLNFQVNKFSPSNITHVFFVDLLSEDNSNFINYYIKGLTNKNNNFNFNF